ncbi:unnamed protein product [Cercospora beticola]|nr:unnamed protein product [Cercospora beticola]
MRLLNTQTLKFGEFFDREIPEPYYILSHRWTRDEISYKDFKNGNNLSSIGYWKVIDFCGLVQERHGASWVWVDTICIDKRSSAELTEAINSMWNWYWRAEICYAYLDDIVGEDVSESQLGRSKWFTRGWTLQELLAPEFVQFLDRHWQPIGHKAARQSHHEKIGPDLKALLRNITGIGEHYLNDPWEIHSASIARRMSWASKRTTTREEDEAYCLLGLLDVNMPLLYGEGRGAFRRLQEELIRTSNDQSIFAFPAVPGHSRGLLARTTADYQSCGSIELSISEETASPCTFEMTNRGIRVQGRIVQCELDIGRFRGRDNDDDALWSTISGKVTLQDGREVLRVTGVPLNCFRMGLNCACIVILAPNYDPHKGTLLLRSNIIHYLGEEERSNLLIEMSHVETSAVTTIMVQA